MLHQNIHDFACFNHAAAILLFLIISILKFYASLHKNLILFSLKSLQFFLTDFHRGNFFFRPVDPVDSALLDITLLLIAKIFAAK